MIKTLKRILGSALFGVLIATAGYAKPPEKPKTDQLPGITINIKDPRTDSKANTRLKNTFVNLWGESVGWLGKAAGADSSPPLRGLEVILDLAGIAHFDTLSHEYGHFRMGEKHKALKPKVTFNLFGGSWYSWKLKEKNLDTLLEINAGGPNQDSLNAQDSFRNSQLGAAPHYTLLDIAYTRLYQLQYLWRNNAVQEGIHDYINMENFLNEKGYDVSLKQMRLNNAVLNLLSLGTLRSMAAPLEFIAIGKREFRPSYFKINKHLKMGLPDFSHFFTTKGDYFEFSQFWKYKNTPVEWNFAHDLDFTHKKAEVNRIRFGMQLHNLKIVNGFNISPYAHANLQRSRLKWKGYSAGIGFQLALLKHFYLTGQLEYNYHDLKACTMGKDNGIYNSLGFMTHIPF